MEFKLEMNRDVIKQFFELLDSYLLGDLETMVIEIGPRKSGGLGYPSMQTILSGMELLGRVLSGGKEDRQAFNFFWDNYFVKENQQYKNDRLKKIFRHSVRDGTAHYFLAKYGIRLTKDNKGNLTKTDEKELSIDIVTFYTDFKKTYFNVKTELLEGENEELLEQFMKGYKSLIKDLRAAKKDIDEYIKTISVYPKGDLTTGESRPNLGKESNLTTFTSSQQTLRSPASTTTLPFKDLEN